MNRKILERLNILAKKKTNEICDDVPPPGCRICPVKETWCKIEKITTAMLCNTAITREVLMNDLLGLLINIVLEQEKIKIND